MQTERKFGAFAYLTSGQVVAWLQGRAVSRRQLWAVRTEGVRRDDRPSIGPVFLGGSNTAWLSTTTGSRFARRLPTGRC